MAKPCLFLDRDGVINRRIPGEYVKMPQEFELLPGVAEAMPLLAEYFSPIMVVTNQQGIGKGEMEVMQLIAVHQKMEQLIVAAGGRLDAVYFCPHRREENCPCRKPATGMAWQAFQDFPDLDFENGWMAGDSVSDMVFAEKLGLRRVLIRGNFDELAGLSTQTLDFAFDSLLDFARFIAA